MEELIKSGEDRVIVSMPVKVRYEAINRLLQKNLKGTIIRDEKQEGEGVKYAEILTVSVEKSTQEDFHLCLHTKVRALTSFFRNREFLVHLHVRVDLDQEKQRMSVVEYQLVGKTGNWFMNQFIQTLSNTLMYSKIKEKMAIDMRPYFQKIQTFLNQKLENHWEVYPHTFVSGALRVPQMTQLITGENHLLLSFYITGNLVADLEQIDLGDFG